ncbi:MAG: hypothetical protein K6V97_11555 [Actinomycetia bacterium]|nr:hypothetical protein [Actinomycetes bacterium]
MGRTDFHPKRRVVWDDRVVAAGTVWRRGLTVRRGGVRLEAAVGVTLYWVDFAAGRLSVRPVRMFLGPRGVVTVHRGPVFAGAAGGLDPMPQPRDVLVGVLRWLTHAKLVALERLDRAVAELETHRAERADGRWEEVAFRLRRAAVRLRRIIGRERLAVHGLLAAGTRAPDVGLLGVYDELVRLLDQTDTCRDLLNGALDAHFSSLSARLNEVVKTLTVLTTGFLPISVVAALYGMNLRYLPAADHPWGFWGLMALMAVAEGGLVVYFRRRRWL